MTSSFKIARFCDLTITNAHTKYKENPFKFASCTSITRNLPDAGADAGAGAGADAGAGAGAVKRTLNHSIPDFRPGDTITYQL